MSKIRALVKARGEPGIWLSEVPLPVVKDDEVLIRVLKTGICGTDLHIYRWDEWARKTIATPMIVGHEFVGEIAEVGTRVVGFEPGMLVSGEGHVVCGKCRNCMAGRRHLCANSSGIGVNRPGAFAEYIAIPYANLWEHHPGVDLEVASIFDPYGNAVHSALQYDLVGEDVLITGAGPIGIMAAAVCRHAGARYIVITDVNPYRLELARTIGVTRAVDVRTESLAEVQRDLAMREGFDVGLEMSGSPSAFRDLLANMCHGGKIALLGLPDREMEVDWTTVVFNMLTIKGIYGREMYETWYKMSVMIEGGLDLSPVITHRFGFEDFQRAFDVMLSGDCGKVVINWAEH